jgi:hypothetical protein
VLNDSLIREYLTPAADTFWEWREGGEVVTWTNGRTIAFREELRTILTWLAPNGLPSLDSIALLLAATHDAWSSASDEVRILREVLKGTADSTRTEELLNELLHWLDKVRSLPSELRTPVRSKAVLLEIVLERCRRVAESDLAALVVDEMRRGFGDQLNCDVDARQRGFAPILLLRDISDMVVEMRRFDIEALRTRIATGLDELPGRAEIELSPAEMARSILDRLKDDTEFAGIARVAKQLLAVAALPRRLDSLDPYHTGGFSDISNRGSMERLLISELANDDLTLAVRVAMNEALYLRREVPPSSPKNHRAVLIDAGIRSWGVPRVFATAVALALMAGTSKGGTYSCFRAKQEGIERGDLATRDGLVKHLKVLEAELHAAAAVPAYLREIQSDADHVEPIFVMTDDALADDAVQQALRRADLPQLFVATVNREGVFRLAERGKHGMKVLREARIDIDDLFRERTSIIVNGDSTDLPAIFAQEPFPLMLGESVAKDRAYYVREWGALSTTGDGRLLRWRWPGHGARQISDGIVGRILWVAAEAVDGIVAVIVGGSSNASLVHVCDQDLVVDSVRLRPIGVGENYFMHKGIVFFVQTGVVKLLNMRTGEDCGTLRLPTGMNWVRDRFFCGPSEKWYALSHDGHSARLEEVVCATGRKLPSMITMFDLPGMDGPIGVTQQGNLISTVTGAERRPQHNLQAPLCVPWISTDGQRLKLASLRVGNARAESVVVNTTHLGCLPASEVILDDRAQALIQPVNLRHRFRAIGLDASGNLALESRKGQLLAFRVQNGLPVLAILNDRTLLRDSRPFKDMLGTGHRYRLAQAVWSDGSRAVLDSRGLLHLRSADRSIPEVTLVLCEGELTGWCANGRMWGKRYFVGEQQWRDESAVEQRSIFDSAVARFAERIHA